jgi:hypothetical protein
MYFVFTLRSGYFKSVPYMQVVAKPARARLKAGRRRRRLRRPRF